MPLKLKTTAVLLTFLLVAVSGNVFGQTIKTPRPSPDATVTQTVGITKVTIDYSSPGVKDRKIWGGLVPYGKVWRTGANEVTSITFDTPVTISGTGLPAGTYGIHTIPGESEWEIIFSKDTKVDDGSAYYPEKDALRIKVKPEEAPFIERMTFLFTNTTDNKTTVNLWWEKLRVSFDVEVNTEELVLSNAREVLSWAPSYRAANYCLQHDVNLDEAMRWIDASILLKEVYWNTKVKAQLLYKAGQKDEAIAMMEKAIQLGAEMENAPFDFERTKKMLAEWKGK